MPLSEPAAVVARLTLEPVSALTAPNDEDEDAVAREEAELEDVAEDEVTLVGDNG